MFRIPRLRLLSSSFSREGGDLLQAPAAPGPLVIMIMFLIIVSPINVTLALPVVNVDSVTHMGSGLCLPLAYREYDYIEASPTDRGVSPRLVLTVNTTSTKLGSGVPVLSQSPSTFITYSVPDGALLSTSIADHSESFYTAARLYHDAMVKDMGFSGIPVPHSVYRDMATRAATTTVLTYVDSVPRNLRTVGSLAMWNTDDGQLRMINVDTRKRVHHGLSVAAGQHIRRPSMCGTTLFYTTVDIATGVAVPWSYPTTAPALPVAVNPSMASVASASSFIQDVWEAHADSTATKAGECSAIVVSVPIMDNSASKNTTNVADVSGGLNTSCSVHVVGNYGLRHHDDVPWWRGTSDRLMDLMVSGNDLYLAVRNETHSVVRHVSLTGASSTPVDIEETTTVAPRLRFLSSTSWGVIYQQADGTTANRVRTYSVMRNAWDWRVPLAHFVCSFDHVLQANETIVNINVLRDVGLVLTDAGRMYRVDLDADNDLVPDATDRFPFDYYVTWDTDNDGIGDEIDLVENGDRSCASRVYSNPLSCPNDFAILYCVWVGFVVVSASVCSAFTYIRARAIEQYRTETEEDKASAVASRSQRKYRMRGQYGESDADILQDVEQNLEDYLSPLHASKWLSNLENAMHWFFVLLTLLSVILSIVPYWNPERLDFRVELILTWTDFFFTTLFLEDLIVRYASRNEVGSDDGEEDLVLGVAGPEGSSIAALGRTRNSTLAFFRNNWFDIPSLLTDIPGVTTTGALDILVVTRLMRILRLLKVFRVWRMYRRLTHQSIWYYFTMSRPIVIMSFICGALMVALSVGLKIVEQHTQDDWENFQNVLWFSIVTVSTVGYGDMSPESATGRAIASIMMMFGIGLIGLFTAAVSKFFLESAFRTKQTRVRQARMDVSAEMSHELALQSVCYNPLTAIFSRFQLDIGEQEIEFMKSPRFTLKPQTTAAEEPSTDPTMVNSPTFHPNSNDNTLNEKASRRLSIEASMRSRRMHEFNRMPRCYDRIELILAAFMLRTGAGTGSVQSPDLLLQRLQTVIFAPTQQNGLAIERLFSIGNHSEAYAERSMRTITEFDDDCFNVLSTDVDWEDPLEEIMTNIEKIAADHDVPRDETYFELMTHLDIATLMFERVETANWALSNLRLKPGALESATPAVVRDHRGSLSATAMAASTGRAAYPE
eukprot:PhM_4_TR16926/c0_g1_i1/m.30000